MIPAMVDEARGDAPDASLRRLELAVSPRTGIVQHVAEALRVVDDARISVFSAVARRPWDNDRPPQRVLGGGAHPVAAVARGAAIAEALERYSASYPERPDEWEFTTAADLGDRAVPPSTFALFAPWQYADDAFPFVPFTAASAVRWVPCWSLASPWRGMMPARFVFLSAPAGDEDQIGLCTSSGLACGTSLDEAILRGLLELIERDAFMIAWHARLALPRIRIKLAPELAARDRAFFAGARRRHTVLDLSGIAGVPTAMACVADEVDGGERFAFGAASAPTAIAAIEKALCEAYHTRVAARVARSGLGERTFRPDFADVVTFEDHVLMYGQPRYAQLATFLFASEEEIAPTEIATIEGATPRNVIAGIVSRLRDEGIDVYASDVTRGDVRELGLFVARVVSPQLCWLNAAHSQRFLGGARLARRVSSADRINPFPHPFP